MACCSHNLHVLLLYPACTSTSGGVDPDSQPHSFQDAKRTVNSARVDIEIKCGKTFRGIRPKNVLSLVREELLDIYENRVTVRLIDHLLVYLRRRIRDVEKLRNELVHAG